MEIQTILLILFRRKWIIIQAFVLILLSTVVSTSFLKPQYETSAKLIIESSDAASSVLEGIGLSSISSMLPSMSSDTTMQNNINLLTVDPIVERVVSLLQLRDRSGELYDAESLLHSNKIISAVFPRPHVEITELKETDIMQITTTATRPEVASRMANTFADIFIKTSLKRTNEEYRNAKIFIEEQLGLAKKQYMNALQEVKRYKLQEHTIDIGIEAKIALEKWAELMKEKEDNIIDLSEVNARISTLKQQLLFQDETAVSESAISNNPQIERIKRTLTDLELELVEALTEKTQNHIDVIKIKEKIKEIKQELKKEMLIRRDSSEELQKLEGDLAALEIHLPGVNKDIEKYSALLLSLPDKELAMAQLNLKISASQELYKSLLESLYQVGVAEAMAIGEIRLIEPAAVPALNDPVSPNSVLNILLGAFVGLIFGLALAMLVDYLDDTFKTPDDVKRYTDTIIFATIPKLGKNDTALIYNRDPKDPISESYRTLRNSIRFSSLDKPVKRLLVTSSLEGEGKSTIAANYAISLSNTDKRVLLIDLDFRRPSVHRKFSCSNNTGVTSLLSTGTNLEDVVQRTDCENLDILTSGPLPPDPGRLIESEAMAELIGKLADQYEYVVLDTPPLLVANDAIVLNDSADASVLVMECDKISQRAWLRTQELLENARMSPLGVVFNKFNQVQRGSYYYYHYKNEYTEGKNT